MLVAPQRKSCSSCLTSVTWVHLVVPHPTSVLPLQLFSQTGLGSLIPGKSLRVPPAADTKGFTLQSKGFGDLNAVAEPLNPCPECLELHTHIILDFCWFIWVQISILWESEVVLCGSCDGCIAILVGVAVVGGSRVCRRPGSYSQPNICFSHPYFPFFEASNCSTMKQSMNQRHMVLWGRTEKAPYWQEQGGRRAFTVTGTSSLLIYPAKAQQKRQLLQMGIQARQRPGRQQLRAVWLRGRQSRQQDWKWGAQAWQMQVGVAVQRFTVCQRVRWISKEEGQKRRVKPKQITKRKWGLKELVF